MDKPNQPNAAIISSLKFYEYFAEVFGKLKARSIYSLIPILFILVVNRLLDFQLGWDLAILLLYPLFYRTRFQILFLECLTWQFLSTITDQSSFFELLGGFFPSFFISLIALNKLEPFVFLSLIKSLIITRNKIIQSLLVNSLYTVFLYIINKDLKTLWMKIKKHKKNNKTAFALWSQMPYPVVILTQKLTIIVKNEAFSEKFENINEMSKIFSDENFRTIQELLKNVFEGKGVETVVFKEKQETCFGIIRSVDWKFERCAEITLIELVEEGYNEKVFSAFDQIQVEILDRLKNSLNEASNSITTIQPLTDFYEFCLNSWSFQLFLQQQLEYKTAADLKQLDFIEELKNCIELAYRKQNKKIDFQLILDFKNLKIFSHEIRVNVFLSSILEYCKAQADSDSTIKVMLKELPNQNVNLHSLSILLISHSFNKKSALQHFTKNVENLEDFTKNLQSHSLSYCLIPSNMSALGIQLQEIKQSGYQVIIDFNLQFHQLSPSKSSRSGSRFIWQSEEKMHSSVKGLLKVLKQPSLNSTFTSKTGKLQKSPGSNSSSGLHPKSMRNLLIPNSIFNIEQHSSAMIKRSETTIKQRKSRQNMNKSPDYSVTNHRPIKRFLFKECIKTLNFEQGVYKVLIVDDFEEYRRVLSGLIKEIMQVSCDFAKDGNGAFEAYESYSGQGFMYQIIFMDLIMPKLNGFEASLKIRNREKQKIFPRTFICAVSGDVDCFNKVSKYDIDDVGKGYLVIRPLDIAKIEGVLRHAKLAAENNS